MELLLPSSRVILSGTEGWTGLFNRPGFPTGALAVLLRLAQMALDQSCCYQGRGKTEYWRSVSEHMKGAQRADDVVDFAKAWLSDVQDERSESRYARSSTGCEWNLERSIGVTFYTRRIKKALTRRPSIYFGRYSVGILWHNQSSKGLHFQLPAFSTNHNAFFAP